MSNDHVSFDKKLTENERRLALIVVGEGTEARKWVNLLLEAYDACDAERLAALDALNDPVEGIEAWKKRKWAETKRWQEVVAERDRLAEALRKIVAMLTTADGLNIPRGEAPKLHARLIADAALAGGGHEPEQLLACCRQSVSCIGVMNPTTCGGCGAMLFVRDRKWFRRSPLVGQAAQEERWHPDCLQQGCLRQLHGGRHCEASECAVLWYTRRGSYVR